MKIATRPQLRRLAVLDRRIRSGKYPNASTVATELGVATRTIHRDIAFLRDAWSAPIVWNDERQGFFYSEADYQLPLQTLTEGELVALFLAERLLQQYRGTPYATAITTAFAKLTNALPEKVTLDLNDLADSLTVRPAPVPHTDIKIFAQLARAVRERLRLRVVYQGMYRHRVFFSMTPTGVEHQDDKVIIPAFRSSIATMTPLAPAYSDATVSETRT